MMKYPFKFTVLPKRENIVLCITDVRPGNLNLEITLKASWELLKKNNDP